MKNNWYKIDYKKITVLSIALLIFLSCSKVESEPPRQEGSNRKEYRLPDPTQMSAQQREEYNRRNREYQENVNK